MLSTRTKFIVLDIQSFFSYILPFLWTNNIQSYYIIFNSFQRVWRECKNSLKILLKILRTNTTPYLPWSNIQWQLSKTHLLANFVYICKAFVPDYLNIFLRKLHFSSHMPKGLTQKSLKLPSLLWVFLDRDTLLSALISFLICWNTAPKSIL